MIYLDNSATTYPKPPQVIRAAVGALNRYGFNPGRGGYRQSIITAQKLFEARSDVKDFFHAADEERVIFTPGCTHALNTVIKGVLRQGDHAVISSLEHNAVARPLQKLQDRGVITYSVVDVAVGDDEETLRRFREALNENTRLIVCTHASNVFGYRLPTERICALAHQYGILFCLDAAQSAGLFPIDMQEDGYDYVCCAGHKYLYGPMGTGLMLVGSSESPDSLIEGGTGSLSSELSMPELYPDRLEAGTLNIPGILGLQAGIRFVSNYGIESIYQKEARMIAHLRDLLGENPHVQLYDDTAEHHHDAPVLSFGIMDIDSETVAEYLSEKHGIAVRAGLHCAPLAHRMMQTDNSGTVRVSPSVYTTMRDMDFLANSLRKIS